MAKVPSIDSVVQKFNRVGTYAVKRRSAVSRMMRMLEHRKHERARRLNGTASLWKCLPNRKSINYEKRRNRRLFFMNNEEEFLTMTGKQLDVIAEAHGVDPNLPVREKQERTYEVLANKYVNGDPVWTAEKVAREKAHFLQALESGHFIGLTCKHLEIKESLVRTWMRTDPNFAEGVRAAQIRTAERVGAKLIVKGVKEGDLGALAILVKQFGDSMKMIEQDAVDYSAQASEGIDITKLTAEEQELLLHLTRKAQAGTIVSSEPTVFVEDDTDLVEESPKLIEAEVFDEND